MYGEHGSMPVFYGDVREWQLLLIILTSHVTIHPAGIFFFFFYLREIGKYAVF